MTDQQLAAAIVASRHPTEYAQALVMVRFMRRLVRAPVIRALIAEDAQGRLELADG